MLDTLLRHLDMVRLSAGMAAMVTLMGCTGLIGSKGSGGGSDGLTPEQQIAQQKWLDNALPVLKTNCTSCHATQAPAFLAGASDLAIRDTLMNFDPQVVNLDAPQSSQLLTHGAHNGPALLADQASALLDWINAEKDAAGIAGTADPMLATAKFMPQICTSGTADNANGTCPVNHVALADAGLPGAHVDLLVQQLSTGLYVTDLALTTDATDTSGNPGQGAYIEHPLFVSWPPQNPDGTEGTPIPDSIDRFYNVKMNLMPAMSQQIGGGLAVFEGFPPTNRVQIQFKVVDKYHMDDGSGGGGGATGGCKVLDSFKTNAEPLMNAACASCHEGQNASATSAMDISGLKNAADEQSACNQVRTRINFQNLDQSGVLLAPDPAGDGAHPFKLGGGTTPTLTDFQTGIKTWAQAEATAP